MLRAVQKLKEAELLEPLVPIVRSCMVSRSSGEEISVGLSV